MYVWEASEKNHKKSACGYCVCVKFMALQCGHFLRS